MTRHLYRLLLRLHPEAFRNRFSGEMLAIFDQMSRGRLWLLADAAGSLGRQWVLREHTVASAAGPGPELALTAVDVPAAFTSLLLRGLIPALLLCAGLTAAFRQPKVASLLDPYFDRARRIVQARPTVPAEDTGTGSQRRPRPVRADDITHALIQQFRRYDVVALGEWHATKEDSEIRINVIRAPGFAASVRSVVFECASALHQDMLDRFVAGADVPPGELRQVWRDVLTPGACDSPVYEEFLRQVRDTNRHLDPARRIRVMAASPPIDWSRAASAADVAPFAPQIDSLPAGLVAEILARGEKALVVFAAAHLWRQTRGVVIPDHSTLIGQLDRGYPGRVYTVLRIHGAKAGFVPLQSSDLGKLPANAYLGRGIPFPVFPEAVTLAQVADAIITTGPFADTLAAPPAPEPGWAAEMARRQTLRRRR